MQEVQVKKSGFATAVALPRLVAEGDRTLVVSLELKPFQLVWLKTLKASKRNSILTFSALGIVIDLCREASNLANGDPLPASLTRLPLTSWKSTGAPVRPSFAPLPAGAAKVFWM